MDVGQPEISSAETVGQSFMIQSQLMQDRGVKVVKVDFIPGGHVSEFVG